MRKLLQRAYLSLISVDPETRELLRMVGDSLALGPRGAVLDVGCGHGRILKPLVERGIDAQGVDANPDTVERNRRAKLACMTPEEFSASDRRFRVIIMAHVIEHLAPDDLLVFLERHMDRIELPGHLVIATPSGDSGYFYDDFDHVRPYTPDSLLMVFTGEGMQTRHRSRYRLAMEDIYFRRSPWRITNARSVYLRSPLRYAVYLANALAALLFVLTFGVAGQTTGWAGRFAVRRSEEIPR